MKESLQNVLKNSKIENRIFENETLISTSLTACVFENSKFLALTFLEINLESAIFKHSIFENCTFEKNLLKLAELRDCKFLNCRFINCNLVDSDFNQVTFEDSSFENSLLTRSWFEKCNFVETKFINITEISLIQTAIIDSKFSKFSKMISFEGEYFLYDLLYPKEGIYSMFIQS